MTTRFVDQYAPNCMAGFDCISTPRWSTDLVQVDSGAEHANQRWENVLNRYTLPNLVREMPVFNAVRDHWLAMRGPFHTWPWRDPLDFASRALSEPNVAPTVAETDEALGTGDGLEKDFQLYRTYAVGAQSYRRKIQLPVVSSVLVKGVAAGSPSDPLPPWTVSRPGGVVTFSYPPPFGMVLTAGFLFDVPVRFESDDAFDGLVRALTLAGTADLTLIETRVC